MFHPQSKNDPYFRKALYEIYRGKCAYCGESIVKVGNLHVDHIYAENARTAADPELQAYLAELRAGGFPVEYPDVIENYLPACQHCNRQKSNWNFTAQNLRYYHNLALNHTPDILKKLEQYRRREPGDLDDFRVENMAIRCQTALSPRQVVITGDHVVITIPSADRGIDLSWDRFKVNFSNTQVEFERLCTDLFRLEYFDRQTVFQSDPNNPGVEIHPKKALLGEYCGQSISFQSKFFGSSVQYNDIKDSAKRTVENYSGELATCFLYCNKNLTKKSYEPIEAILNAAGIQLELIVGDHLLDRIREYPELVERYFYK